MSQWSRGLSFAVLTIVTVLLFTSSFVCGQVVGGAIGGTVADQSNALLDGASVTARNTATGVELQTTTNAAGYYEFPLLAAGPYVLTAQRGGFQRTSVAQFTLSGGVELQINIQLHVGEVSQTVDVISTAPLVNASNTELGTVIENDKVTSLPLNGRSFVNLIGLQPGVVNVNAEPVTGGSVTGQRGGVEFNGSPALDTIYLLDGVDMSLGENNGVGDQATGTGGKGAVINTISVDAILEMKTTGSAFQAEYGRTTSGVVNVTTKSGTNNFHGTLFEFFRNDAMNASSYFANRAHLAKPELRHNQYGGNFGGPLLRKRLFFFFNFEGAKVLRGQILSGNVPTSLLLSQITDPALHTAYAAMPPTSTPTSDPLVGLSQRNAVQSNDELTTDSRVDYYVSKHHLAVRGNYNNQDYLRPLFLPGTFLPFPTRFRNLGFQDNFTISSNKLNEFRFGFNATKMDRFSSDLKPGGTSGSTGILSVATGTVLADTGRQDRIRFDDHSWTIADNFSWIRDRHSIKIGVEARKLNTNRIVQQSPFVSYNGIADLIAANPFEVDVSFGVPPVSFGNWDTGFYVQDDWRVNRRLTLNLGLRYEYYTPLTGPLNVVNDPYGSFAPSGTPLLNPDRNNFAPRLGLVADLFGNGNTILRAGGGITYSPIQPYFYENMGWLPGPNGTALPFDGQFLATDLPPSVPLTFPFPLSFQEQVISDPTLIPPGLKIGREVVDRNSRAPYAGQWNLAVQKKLTNFMSLQVAYVGSRALKLLNSSEINLLDPSTGERVHPDLGSVIYFQNESSSSYHALQVLLNEREFHGLNVSLNYTYSKVLQYGNVDGSAFNGDPITQDLSNFRGSYGPKASDTTHRYVMDWTYQIPAASFSTKSAVGRAIFGGWQLSGLMNFRTGYPVNVVTGVDVVGNGRANGQRPDRVSNVDAYLHESDPTLWLNRAAFDAATPAAEKRFGDLGYNAVRARSAYWIDAAIHKNFPIFERQNLEFRLEAFNALNHVVFGAPVSSLRDPNFGKILTGSDGRSLQLGLKYTF